jgi:hypothetical protein
LLARLRFHRNEKVLLKFIISVNVALKLNGGSVGSLFLLRRNAVFVQNQVFFGIKGIRFLGFLFTL